MNKERRTKIDRLKKWRVRRVHRTAKGSLVVVDLGHVVARHQPDALMKARHKWPDERDESQVQAGFSVSIDNE